MAEKLPGRSPSPAPSAEHPTGQRRGSRVRHLRTVPLGSGRPRGAAPVDPGRTRPTAGRPPTALVAGGGTGAAGRDSGNPSAAALEPAPPPSQAGSPFRHRELEPATGQEETGSAAPVGRTGPGDRSPRRSPAAVLDAADHLPS